MMFKPKIKKLLGKLVAVDGGKANLSEKAVKDSQSVTTTIEVDNIHALI
jgi:hypothetical protein